MGLFSKSQIDQINAIAQKSKVAQTPVPAKKVSSINDELIQSSKAVEEYFKDSPAILIQTKQQLHDYVTAAIEHKYVGIDTETTGLDREKDYVVGASLYYPGGTECYIPLKHRIPIFEDFYKGQLSYSDLAEELNRLVDGKVRLIFANANYDLYMIWKDLKVDLCPAFYYDVILAWRCLKEDELHNGLKDLYNKYVLRGKGDPKQFSDFFSPALFPYCKPEIAKLYAANDAKITYDLFTWQLPFLNKTSELCQKHKLENIADLVWRVEFPLVSLIQQIERTGMYIDQDNAKVLQNKYHALYDQEMKNLQDMVQNLLDNSNVSLDKKRPFSSGANFNPKSPLHVKYLLYTLLDLPKPNGKESTGKEVLEEFNLPITSKIIEVRSLATNINTFIDKLPQIVSSDKKIHADFRQIGASTGRMCISEGTKISILNGCKNIEDLQPGDLVYCYDGNKQLQLAPVKRVWLTGESRDCVDVQWQSSGSGDIGHLICTPEHPILLKTGQWVRADSLKRYDKVVHMHRTATNARESRPDIYGWDGHHMIQSVTPAGKYRVYDIEVEGYHNFIANEICVHNSSASPNLQNIPSKLADIRHMFRATPNYVILSSDFSQQEPRLTGFVAQDKNMIKAFQEGKDIYATIASIAFHTSYENCLEFNPQTGEYQPDGKARRNEAKTIVLGICYGRSVPSIGEQLYHSRDDMSDEERTEEAQKVYDSVMKAFPALQRLMLQSQAFAKKHGYVETIFGRRRHLPDMMLDEFEFKPLPGYVNPDVDPLDLSTLNGESGIPARKLKELKEEFSKFKYYGQVVKRTKELYNEESIKVINNRPKINDSKRQCVNCVDSETEILTLSGWKRYDEVNIGDEILSYSLEKNEIVKDVIQYIHIQEDASSGIDVYSLSTSTFDAVCTEEHRWVMRNFDTDEVRFFNTSHLLKVHRPRYHILRVAPNNINTGKVKIFEGLWVEDFIDGKISFDDILSLPSSTAYSLYSKLVKLHAKQGAISFKDESIADKFQVLALMANRVANKRAVTTKNKKKPNTTTYKVGCPQDPLYETARLDYMAKNPCKTSLVWCVTTEQGTWIARRSGKYYITGNSIIQGSAADFTKTALIKVMTDPRWEAIGGRVLTVVHDEIVAEVPADRWEEGGNILKDCMESSGSFLPFPINCDVTASYRWYGLELPCKFTKPESLELTSENDISWVQWYLVEMGFELPIFKDEDGNKPIGDAAHGVSGKISQEMLDAIQTYCDRYQINQNCFLNDIEQRVETGIVIKED